MCRRGALPQATADSEAKLKPNNQAGAEQEKEEEGNIVAPDRAEFGAALAKIQKTIENLHAQQAMLRAKMSGRSASKEYLARRSEYRAQLDELTAKIDDLSAKKGQLDNDMNVSKQEELQRRNQSRMKASGCACLAATNDRIAQIEAWLRTETVSLKAEKGYMYQIERLKRDRLVFRKMAAIEVPELQDRRAELWESLGAIKKELAFYRDTKRQVSHAMASLKQSHEEELHALSEYAEQCGELAKTINIEMGKRDALRDDFRRKQWEVNTWRHEQRRARQDRMCEERQAKQAEWEMMQLRRRAQASDRQPYVAEISLIEQSVLFCKSAGTCCMKLRGTPKNRGFTQDGARPIKHSLATVKLFDQMQVSVPMTTADLPGTLEQLEAKLCAYRESEDIGEGSR